MEGDRLMIRRLIAITVALTGTVSPLEGQHPPGQQGSANVHIVSHLPLGRRFTTADIEIEQELSRPYAYVSRMTPQLGTGFDIINIKDPTKPSVLYQWRIEESELHLERGATAPAYLKSKGRYYFVQAFQFSNAGPDADMGAVVVDVTGLPDTSKVKEVGRIRIADAPGGMHEIFAYRHSDGRALLFTTVTGRPRAHIYDIDRFAAKDPNQGLVGPIPIPDANVNDRGGYHDFYVGYDPATHQDKFYGAGWNYGYFVFDVTQPESPKLVTSISGVAGGNNYHTFTPTPDGRYAVTEMEYQYAPLRIFDLKPGLDGQVKTISRPIGAWVTNWQNLPHNHEVRWPYVFVSDYEDGLSIMNMMDPTNPYTVGYFDTYDGPHMRGWGGPANPDGGTGVANGAFGVDVRNADGLIVISDIWTGFWAFKMDGFDGWNGHQWGMPNISSAQDWDNGPEGAPKPSRVS